MGQKSKKIFHYVVWKNGLVGILLPTIMASVIHMYGKFQSYEQHVNDAKKTTARHCGLEKMSISYEGKAIV